MDTPAITWRPPKIASNEALIAAMRYYVGERPTNFRLYENGTVLLIKAEGDSQENAHRCLHELTFIPDFRVVEMRDGNFTVTSHEVVMVLLLSTEISAQLAELTKHQEQANLPGRCFYTATRTCPLGLWGERSFGVTLRTGMRFTTTSLLRAALGPKQPPKLFLNFTEQKAVASRRARCKWTPLYSVSIFTPCKFKQNRPLPPILPAQAATNPIAPFHPNLTPPRSPPAPCAPLNSDA